MNIKLQSRKHNLKRQMCSAAYWVSPATLCEISALAVTLTHTLSVCHTWEGSTKDKQRWEQSAEQQHKQAGLELWNSWSPEKPESPGKSLWVPGQGGKTGRAAHQGKFPFPLSLISGGMLASKLLKNILSQQPWGSLQMHIPCSELLAVREKPESHKTCQWCAHFPLREIKTWIISVKLTQNR